MRPLDALRSRSVLQVHHWRLSEIDHIERRSAHQARHDCPLPCKMRANPRSTTTRPGNEKPPGNDRAACG
jgi:hypothetical protein